MKKLLTVLCFILVSAGCNNNKKVGGVYRYFMGKEGNYNIWIVNAISCEEYYLTLAESHFRIAIPDSLTHYAGTIDLDEKLIFCWNQRYFQERNQLTSG